VCALEKVIWNRDAVAAEPFEREPLASVSYPDRRRARGLEGSDDRVGSDVSSVETTEVFILVSTAPDFREFLRV
jgi:hypothetical protein